MIIGIDHVALSAPDTAAARSVLAVAGFSESFTEMGAVNAPGKRAALARYQDIHDLAVFRPAGGIAFEVTNHGPTLAEPEGAFHPIVVGAMPRLEYPSTAATEASAIATAYGSPVAAAVWRPFDARVWHVARDGPVQIPAVSACVFDLNEESKFWARALGFKETVRKDGMVRLTMASPIAAWRGDVLLTPSDRISRASLDSRGFPCLALLCTDIAADTERVAQGGATDIIRFEANINRKTLSIAIARTPGALLVELIQIHALPSLASRPSQRDN